jgi:hypothetical protein
MIRSLALFAPLLLAATIAEADSTAVGHAAPAVGAPSGPLDREPATSITRPRLGSVQAMRLTEPIVVDGVLSEVAWRSAVPATDFRQLDPVEGVQPSQRTEVRIAYDDDAVYVGARLFDDSPDSIYVRLARRDVAVQADRFRVYLDPQHDKRSGYYFMVNAAGTQYDGTLLNDGMEDASWDGVWAGKAKLDDQGWTVEMRIPYSQLRFPHSQECVWGINFARVIQRRSESVYLVYTPKKENGFVSRFPNLVGIKDVHPGRAIEVLPYVTSKAEFLASSPNDPFHDGSEFEGSAGGDLRIRVGGRLTLNATVNPDFGQVEVDPAVVNLSDVETFFQEKRPFFVEGSSNFRFGNEGASNYWGFNWPEPTFFYSRRVGRSPQGSIPDSAYADAPLGTTILGAAKLTGKPAPGWNLGSLSAITGRESAELAGDFGSQTITEIEPPTYYGVLRGQREIAGRRYGLGLMGTLAARDFQDPHLRDELNTTSLMTGFDGWAFLDSSRTWVISGWTAASYIHGNEARIAGAQTDPRHYFQRPDATHVEFDPTATSLSGWGSRYWLNREKGSMIFNAALGAMSPGFDVNDVGFHTRSDLINSHVGGGYKWTETTKTHKYRELIGALFGTADFGGNVTNAGVWALHSIEFVNNNSWELRAAMNPESHNNRRTRGGPLMLNKPGYEAGTYFDTDGKARVFWFVGLGGYAQPEADSYDWYFEPGVEWKPGSSFNLRVGPGLYRNVDDAQYIDTIEDATATHTYGARYIFGDLDQTTLSANIRLNWSFSPTLSLQTYIQPLMSTGDYSAIKELARPDSYAFNVYGEGSSTFDPTTGVADPDGPAGPAAPIAIGNPDFDFVSLRGNAVLRWEYRPGSTFYLVWTQERTDEDTNGNFDVDSSFRRMLSADADDIFLAKFTYYFNL